jgi:predicted transposase YdaD
MLGITLQETRVYREIKAVGREEGIVVGREEATTNLILRQLTRRFGAISEDLQIAIADLPLHRLEDLSEALLDFTSLADLQAWLG